LLNLAFVRTADGWEGYETFVDAAAYEKHSENTMAYPNIGRVFEAAALYDETESWICGREDEIAKAPKIAEYYPTQKRIFVQDNNQQFGMHHLGYINKADGHDAAKKGGSLVFEFEFEYTSAEAGPKAKVILQKLEEQMRKDKELTPSCFPLLKFWHTEGRKGYKCIEICRTAKQYDTHC